MQASYASLFCRCMCQYFIIVLLQFPDVTKDDRNSKKESECDVVSVNCNVTAAMEINK